MEDQTGSPGSEASDETPALEFPDDFPLDISIYDQEDFDDDYYSSSSPPPSPRADVDDPRRRTLDSLYPLDWLHVDHTAAPASARTKTKKTVPTVGELRARWRQKFGKDRGGEWDYVEYVPAWTDPDWDARCVYTGGEEGGGGEKKGVGEKEGGGGKKNDGDDDEDEDDEDNDDADDAERMARRYAKPGLLQTQRPALRPADAARRPTEAAKRWGIYPYRQWANLAEKKGWSGVTPRAAGFPAATVLEVPLAYPRPVAGSGDGGDGMQCSVGLGDLEEARREYEEGCRGEEEGEEGFRAMLRAQSVDTSDVLRADRAGSLLVLLEAVERREEREEYQRLIFGGHTSNDLVEKGVWTMGVDASVDLAEPLHDLVTRDKWARTEDRGVSEEHPRVVYDISGKQGEYTAHDDTLWTALQPALQLVTKVLSSGHPLTWAWADVRKLRPVEGYRDLGARFRKGEEESDPDAAQRRRRLGIDRRWKFALWPDEDADAEGETETERGREPQLLTGAAAGWDEFRRICESGFDATPYACGILARCIEWVVEPTYRITGSDAYRSYGQTGCERLGPGSGDRRPFKIRIDVAADLMWPLLVDEYSPAEKAAATTYVAVTMLHEISHALCIARCQMFSAGTKDGRPPPWLDLNPAWRKEILAFNARKRVNILALLHTFSMRMRWDADYMADDIFWPEDELYYKDEPNNEEGWATENQYFGGVVETLPGAITTMFRKIKAFRFLSDVTVMAAKTGWATDPGAPGRFLLAAPMPRDTYLRFFNQSWWDNEFRAYGVSAMKFDSGSAYPPLSGTLRTLESFSWALVARRYGDDARDWMRKVWDRMQDESENQILWRYLYYKTVVATEPQACEDQWYNEQANWDEGDLAIWNDWTRLMERLGEMNDAITAHSDQDTDTVDGDADPPLDEFRRLFAAVRSMQAALSREATYHQNLGARYLTLEDCDAKRRLWRLYAPKIRTRVRGLYLRIARDLVALLDSFGHASLRTPTIAAWLRASHPAIDRMWTTDAADLRARVRRDARHLQTVCDVFSDDDDGGDDDDASGRRRRLRGAAQLGGALPRAAALDQARRLRRLAMRQHGRLRPMDPRRRCADEWLAILRRGDLLRKAPAPVVRRGGSPAWQQRGHNNRRLAAGRGAATVGSKAVEAHGGLVEQEQHQLPHAAPVDRCRYLSADHQRERFAMASGYQAYRDEVTGFTRFAQVPVQQQQQYQHQHLPATRVAAAATANAERRIEEAAATLAQMRQQTGAPFCADDGQQQMQMQMQGPAGAQTAFGLSAAQCGQTVQQLEGLVGEWAEEMELD